MRFEFRGSLYSLDLQDTPAEAACMTYVVVGDGHAVAVVLRVHAVQVVVVNLVAQNSPRVRYYTCAQRDVHSEQSRPTIMTMTMTRRRVTTGQRKWWQWWR